MATDRAFERGESTCNDCMVDVSDSEIVTYEARGSTFRHTPDDELYHGHTETIVFVIGDKPKARINILNSETTDGQDGDVLTQLIDEEVAVCTHPTAQLTSSGLERRCSAISEALKRFNVMNGQKEI